MLNQIRAAKESGCQLVAFGEALLPGYPFWVELTNGALFNSPMQKEIHAHYMDQAVQIEAGHLDPFCGAAKAHGITVVAGIIERPLDRGGHSLYASLVYIDSNGVSLTAEAGTGNIISLNSIYSNGSLGIDLGENGVTLNDLLDANRGPTTYKIFHSSVP